MINDNLKYMYDKALVEAVNANDRKNKVVINALRVKCEKFRSERNNAITSASTSRIAKEKLKGLYNELLQIVGKTKKDNAEADKNKALATELRTKCETIRNERNTALRGVKRNQISVAKVSTVVVKLQLDGELNLSRQQIADRCSVTLDHINKLFSKIKRESK
jgi:hypothetical protein